MQSETQGIPNLQIKTIGSGKNRLQVIAGFVEMPCWDGYFLEENLLNTKKEKEITAGRIDLSVDGRITSGGNIDISQEQVNAYWYLVEHQEYIQQVILEKLLHDFPRLLADDYSYFDHEEGGFPTSAELKAGFDFKQYIGPNSITIGELQKDDMAYITWYLRCRWDTEHGFQIIMHKDRVIDLGEDPDIWKVLKDNGTYEQEWNAYNAKAWPVPKKKKWWQFW